MVLGTAMAASQGFSPIYPLHLGGSTIAAYAAVYALIANFVASIILTPLCDAMRLPRHGDATTKKDYEDYGLDVAPIPAR
jgi:SSS family solute:Na+ symporter